MIDAGTATVVVVYTGKDTRSSMNTSSPRSKVSLSHLEPFFTSVCVCVCVCLCVCVCVQIGLVDLEINRLTKLLFLATMLLSLILLSLKVCMNCAIVSVCVYICILTILCLPYYVCTTIRASLVSGSYTSSATSSSSHTLYPSGQKTYIVLL